jgi:hypothetical protein
MSIFCGARECRRMTTEEARLYDQIGDLADGHHAGVVVAVCLCLLVDVWRSRPEDIGTDEFIEMCSHMIRENIENIMTRENTKPPVSPSGSRH